MLAPMSLPAAIRKPDNRARVEVEKELSWIASLLFTFCGNWFGYRALSASCSERASLSFFAEFLLDEKPGCASQIAQEYLQHNKLIATGKPRSSVGHHPEEKAVKLS